MENDALDASCNPVGPFGEYYRVRVGNFEVPYIEAHKTKDGWSLTLDHRFGVDMSDDELQRFMWWIANAMAIAAGYTSFGENSKPSNPFKTQLVGLNIDPLFPFPVKE